MNWTAVKEYLYARMAEPSTWVSLGSVFTGLGVVIAPDKWQAITAIGLGLGGLLGAGLRERKKTTPEEIKQVVEQTVEPKALKNGNGH